MKLDRGSCFLNRVPGGMNPRVDSHKYTYGSHLVKVKISNLYNSNNVLALTLSDKGSLLL